MQIQAGGGGDDGGGRYRRFGGLNASALEALPAQHGAALSGFEGHGGFDVALGALGTGLGARYARRGDTAARASAQRGSLGLAGLAPFGIVLELFIEKEDLLSGRENELAVAIHTGK
ncbi:MAG TPA: hypothetical protein VNW54_10665 [Granulicella sp.]|nr:hypothetical protein [Granulicella sp.]